MNITILLLGITGDLAKRKILPAIAQFSNNYQGGVKLVGYSRSQANKEEIQGILDGHQSKAEVAYEQGQYDDVDAFTTIFDQATTGDDKLIVYLAVPPHAFIPFIERVCPLKPQNIDIVIEKPFGSNYKEAQKLIETASNCALTKCIHFFDHYQFKSSTFLTKAQAEELTNFQSIRPYKISVRALEVLGVDGRAGYYKSAGALKDMWQHLQSMVEIYKSSFGVDLDWSKFTVHKKILGQYESFHQDIGEKTTTDSFFHIEGDLDGVKVEFESGKKIGFKDTVIEIEYDDNAKIKWNLDPIKYIEVTSGIRKLNEIMLEESKLLDHARLLSNLVEEDYHRFVSFDKVLETWQAYHKIIEFEDSMKLLTYTDGSHPLH